VSPFVDTVGVFMVTFLIGIIILVGGGFLYGNYCEKVFGPDDRETPAITKADGVDFIMIPEIKTDKTAKIS